MKRIGRQLIMLLVFVCLLGFAVFPVLAENDEEEKTELPWQNVLENGVYDSDETLYLTEDATIPVNGQLFIRGDLVIEPGVTLTNEGLLAIENGSLVVSEGASLINHFFMRVTDSGKLDVQGEYEQSDYAGFVWEDQGGSSVEGVKKDLIDRTVFANSIRSLQNLNDKEGYRTVTVAVSEMMIVKELYGDILNGIVLAAQ